MHPNNQSPRWRFAAAAASALIVLAAACSSADAPDLESLGLAIETDIQAGSMFEVVVPQLSDTTVTVATMPAGVTAAVTPGPTDGSMKLTVNVEFDTPRGSYNLGLAAVRGGEEYEVGWPFDVTDPGGASSPTGPVATTAASSAASSLEAVLTVDSPQPGDIFVSSDIVRGLSTSPLVGYRLWGGGIGGGNVIDENTLDTVDGAFEAQVLFRNICCTEMTLEVFQIDSGDLVVTIPLTYPEPG